MEEVLEFDIGRDPREVLQYFSEPRNILGKVPYIKSVSQFSEYQYRVTVKWLIQISADVTKRIGTDVVSYFIEREGFPSIRARLNHIVLKTQGGSRVRIEFNYTGPFEKIASVQVKRLLQQVKVVVENDLLKPKVLNTEERRDINVKERINVNLSVANMKTLFTAIIEAKELERLIEKVVAESVGRSIVLLLSDTTRLVKVIISNGDIVGMEGDIYSLKGKVSVVGKEYLSQNP